SDQGFFIIPGQVFKSRAVYSSGQLLSRVSGGMVLSKDETISLSVPLNALKEDAAIQINGLSPLAAPPVNANRRLLAATDIQPAGLEFLFPATIKMPLLRKQKPGSSIPLESLTGSDNQYIPNGRTAIIASDGMSASASISRPGSFVLTSEKPVVSVTPSKITVAVGEPVQFSASVSGNGIEDVEWSVDGIPGGTALTGRIRPDGLYTAPRRIPLLGSVSVKAVSVDDPTSSFEAQVTIFKRTDRPDGPDMPEAPDPIVAPTVSAGPNQTITLPSSASLSGTVTDPCLPNCTVTVRWSMASGPGTVTFGNAAALSTTAAFSTAGTYVLQLTASVGTLSSSANVTIIVNPTQVTPPPPPPPTTGISFSVMSTALNMQGQTNWSLYYGGDAPEGAYNGWLYQAQTLTGTVQLPQQLQPGTYYVFFYGYCYDSAMTIQAAIGGGFGTGTVLNDRDANK